MPRLDRRTFEGLSQRTDFQIDVLEKVYRLTELLKEIHGTELGQELVLKGGTAINFLHLDFPRLSVDIDMDYIGSTQKREMETDRNRIETTLEKIFKTLGYTVKGDSSYALQQYDLFYENTAENRDRVQAEINFLKRSTYLGPIKEEFEHFFNFENFKVLTLQREELFGRKMKALLKRGTARDLYDIYRLLESDINFDKTVMRRCFVFSLCLDGDPRDVETVAVEGINDRDVKRTLNPLLRRKESKTSGEMKRKVIPLIEDFLDYGAKELEFIENLFDGEVYKPEILFKDMDYSSSIEEHPGIKWRIKKMGE